MTRIEDHLSTGADRLRRQIEGTADVDAALSRTVDPDREPRGAAPTWSARGRLLVAAAVLAVVAVAGAFIIVADDGEQIVTDEGPAATADPSPATSSEEADPAPTTPDDDIAFEVLGRLPAPESRPGSLVYAGVADALADQWTITGSDQALPNVDFDRRAVFGATVEHPQGCVEELTSLELDGDDLALEFTAADTPGGGADCGTDATTARTTFVSVGRDSLPRTFTLVLPAARDGSYGEQRLDVDLSTNFAFREPAAEAPPGPPPVDGPDLAEPDTDRRITFDSVGDVALGDALAPSEFTPHDGLATCGYWGPDQPTHDGDEPLHGIAGGEPDDPRVISIMVRRNPRYRTVSGVGVGTTLPTLERIYGDDLVVDRADGWDEPTDGLLASYQDVAAVRNGDRALTFHLAGDTVEAVKVSAADFWGDDEGCA